MEESTRRAQTSLYPLLGCLLLELELQRHRLLLLEISLFQLR